MRSRRTPVVAFVGLAIVAAGCVPKSEPAPPPPPAGTPVVVTPLTCPLNGYDVGSGFGPRGTGFHSGIDLLAPLGTPLFAVRAGTATFVPNESGGGGHTVYLTGGGYTYQYAHLNDFVGGNRTVAEGELIGHVGQTGNATTPHLHFGMRVGSAAGTRVDPLPTLDANHCT